MNDRVKDEQHSPRIVPVVGPVGETRHLDSYGIGVRIDPAHTYPTETRDVDWPNLQSPAAMRESESAAVSSPSRDIGKDAGADDLWQQFRRQQDQLLRRQQDEILTENAKLIEQNQSFRNRILNLEEELQQQSFRVTKELSQLDAKKTQIQKDETALAERHLALEVQSRKFEAERETILFQHAELERRKKSLRDEVVAELNVERNEIESAKADLQADLDHAHLLKDALQTRLNSFAADNAQALNAEREKLWQALTEEWEQRKVGFQRERDEWKRICETEKLGIDREKAMFESAVESANTEFLKGRETFALERETLALELAELRADQTKQLESERLVWEETRRREESRLTSLVEAQQAEMLAIHEQFQNQLSAAGEEWEQSRKREMAEIDAVRAELLAEREGHDTALAEEREDWQGEYNQQKSIQDAQYAEWLASRDSMLAASREALEVEFMAQREQHAQMLQSDREESENAIRHEQMVFAEKQSEFARERTLIENRIRFQRDHLDKSRAEFEQAQNEFRRERQVEQQRLEEANLITIRRLKQVDLYRTSIDAREQSLDREQEAFNRVQKTIASTADVDRANFQAQKHAWDSERETQRSEMRRQEEELAIRSESLEGRRARLDKLRGELEETHRATLEMRLAVEESWAQLTHAAGQDDARERVERVRLSLAGYYQQMHDSLSEQRREYIEAQSKFERQRGEFGEERQKLTAWLTKRDEELQVGEERLRISANEAAANHTKWLSARDRWLLEKTEAEQLIRRLLSSLGENNRQQSGELQAMSRLDEIKLPFENSSVNRL